MEQTLPAPGDYEFICREQRRRPDLRTTVSVFEACALVEETSGLDDYLGM